MKSEWGLMIQKMNIFKCFISVKDGIMNGWNKELHQCFDLI